MKKLITFLILILLLAGCFPFPGDREALKESCSVAETTSKAKCRGYCDSACNNGAEACLINIGEDKPTDWQPADAFYDGCSDSCSDDLCSSACYAGQSVAASNSAERLRKYGTRTF